MDQMSQFLLTAQELSQNIQNMNGVIWGLSLPGVKQGSVLCFFFYIIIILKYSKILISTETTEKSVCLRYFHCCSYWKLNTFEKQRKDLKTLIPLTVPT